MRASILITSAALSLGALATTGCGNLQSDRCDAVCDCNNCGEQAREICDVTVEADWEVAEAYDCTELLEPVWQCQLERHECDDNGYHDDHEECGEAERQYAECIDGKSSRRSGPY